jgi:hypothetical protein
MIVATRRPSVSITQRRSALGVSGDFVTPAFFDAIAQPTRKNSKPNIQIASRKYVGCMTAFSPLKIPNCPERIRAQRLKSSDNEKDFRTKYFPHDASAAFALAGLRGWTPKFIDGSYTS